MNSNKQCLTSRFLGYFYMIESNVTIRRYLCGIIIEVRTVKFIFLEN